MGCQYMLQPPTTMDGGDESIISKKGEDKHDQESYYHHSSFLSSHINQASFLENIDSINYIYTHRLGWETSIVYKLRT